MTPQTRLHWKRRDKMILKSDPIMKDPQPTDFIIAIMGPTGSGKSTFINKLLDREAAEVGHSLRSCTAQLQPIIVDGHPKLFAGVTGRLIIVDTPGFDDTYEDDSEILRRISVWLAASYSDSMKLGGMIYMHEITQVRMFGTTLTNTTVFKELCGTDTMSSVVLVTTKWSNIKPLELGLTRENELVQNYWKEMIKPGKAIQKRFLNSEESAWSIVNYIVEAYMVGLNNDQYLTLKIQKELVELQKIIPDTEAAKSLRVSLEQAFEMHRKMAEQARHRPRSGSVDDEDYKEEQHLMRNILRQIGELKVSFPRRLLAAFGGA